MIIDDELMIIRKGYNADLSVLYNMTFMFQLSSALITDNKDLINDHLSVIDAMISIIENSIAKFDARRAMRYYFALHYEIACLTKEVENAFKSKIEDRLLFE